MKKKRNISNLYISSPLVLLFCIQCSTVPINNEILITDVSKSQEFSLEAEKNSKIENFTSVGISGIKILLTGHIDGEAQIIARYGDTLMLQAGNINDSISGDFYSSECPLKFIPLNSKIGEICIKYSFSKL